MQDPKASMNSNTFIEEWSAYALEHSQSIPDLLLELEKETYQKVLQPRMLSSPLQGRFLSLLSQLIKPKKILEIGTFTGYASLCLAEGLQKEGELHTIDNNAELVYLQEKYFIILLSIIVFGVRIEGITIILYPSFIKFDLTLLNILLKSILLKL